MPLPVPEITLVLCDVYSQQGAMCSPEVRCQPQKQMQWDFPTAGLHYSELCTMSVESVDLMNL